MALFALFHRRYNALENSRWALRPSHFEGLTEASVLSRRHPARFALNVLAIMTSSLPGDKEAERQKAAEKKTANTGGGSMFDSIASMIPESRSVAVTARHQRAHTLGLCVHAGSLHTFVLRSIGSDCSTAFTAQCYCTDHFARCLHPSVNILSRWPCLCSC